MKLLMNSRGQYIIEVIVVGIIALFVGYFFMAIHSELWSSWNAATYNMNQVTLVNLGYNLLPVAIVLAIAIFILRGAAGAISPYVRRE